MNNPASRRVESPLKNPPAQSLWEQAALLTLLALIPIRVLLKETHTFEILRLLRTSELIPPGAQPGTTFFIFALILAVSVLVATVRWWRGEQTYRRTGAEWGFVLLCAAGTWATWRAGQKHLALIGTLDFLGLVLYGLTLRQLLTQPWHVRLILTVILATGAMVLVKCGYQKWSEFPATLEYYQQYKSELLTATVNNGPTDSAGLLYDYEQRLKSQLVSGYFAHSNALGSYASLLVLTGLAMVTARFRRLTGWAVVAPLLISGGGLVAVVLAQSKGAAAACAVGITFWLVGWWWAGRHKNNQKLGTIAAPRWPLWLTTWLALLAAGVVIVAVLRSHPEALGRSMLFRYMYWQGAWDMIGDLGPGGVGPDNFGRHFARYKPAACPEDVSSPHSWIVQMASEWGVLGLIGGLLLFIGVSKKLATAPEAPNIPSTSPTTSGSITLWLGGIGLLTFGWYGWLLWGANAWFWATSMLVAIVPWLAGFIAVAIEDPQSTRFRNDWPGPLVLALSAGLLCFLIHTSIDLALFDGGAATTFFALLATALAAKQWRGETGDLAMNRPSTPRRPGIAVIVGGAGLLGVVGILAGLVIPSARLGDCLHRARVGDSSASTTDASMSFALRDGLEIYLLDSTAAEELVEFFLPRTSNIPIVDSALAYVDEFERRDGFNASVAYQRAILWYRRFDLARNPIDLEQAVANMRQAVAAYPTSPSRRLVLADMLTRQTEILDSAEARHAAIAELETALRLESQRVYVSSPHRMSPEAISEIEMRINTLRDMTTQ